MNKLLAVLLGIFGMGTASADKQFEASAGFDSDIVHPFLERLNTQLGLGFDVVSLVTFTESVPHDDEQSRNINVTFKGEKKGWDIAFLKTILTPRTYTSFQNRRRQSMPFRSSLTYSSKSEECNT